ncbi:MAG: class I SAM-dependent methyltransferase [Acidobacteriota bacterium]
MDERLFLADFPRASRYHPEWLLESASGAANSLWLAEWLAGAMELRPGIRVLDLGCGRGASSIFLRREFGVEVWAADLWFSAGERVERIRDAGVEDGVRAVQADATALPFEAGFFDAIMCIDSFQYFATDDLYLQYLVRFVKPGGLLALAGAGFEQEVTGEPPEHLRDWWTPDVWTLHSIAWWRRHWERTGFVDILTADTMRDGWKRWLEWVKAVAPGNVSEIGAIEGDAGRFLGYVRLVARRRESVEVPEPVVSVPAAYEKKPLLREG